MDNKKYLGKVVLMVKNKYFRILVFIALVSAIVFLAMNQEVWAGNFSSHTSQAGLANLTGVVWNDVNRDGIHNGNEEGIPNVTVDLFDSDDTFVNTAMTDADGRYQFINLAPGEYYVAVLPPAGYVFSPQNQSGEEALDSDADVLTGRTSSTTLTEGENFSQWDVGLFQPTTYPASSDPGTVQPPPAEITVCAQGDYSVGGVSILNVYTLESGYCLAANLWNHAFALGRIPDGAGRVQADITFLRVFSNGEFVYELPSEDENDEKVKICYAVPPNITDYQIYFFDFYGPRFGERTGQPSWDPLDPSPTEPDGMACAIAQTSGAYALIGK
jgi:hypothetical protein